jgi:hypothetical protein
MAKTHLKLATPAIKKRAVAPWRLPDRERRSLDEASRRLKPLTFNQVVMGSSPIALTKTPYKTSTSSAGRTASVCRSFRVRNMSAKLVHR